jgi:hypothetical protein
MTRTTRTITILLAGAALPILTGCGASDIATPGTGGSVTINNITPAPTPTPTPTPTSTLVTPAGGCPTISDPQGLTDAGTITGPTGTWRICELPTRINKSITLTKIPGLLYALKGRTDVGTDGGKVATADSNVTLTIEPGVIVFARTGTSWLAVNRGNKIDAVGTATKPIIFTSQDNILGYNNNNSSGQWGGVVLLGRAPVTDCTVASAATPGTVDCERDTEGAIDPAYYGGAEPTYNAGKLSYVQIRFSGYVLSANNELQSLTTEGVGSGTTLDHIQSYNSSDDGAEFFGGTVHMKYFVSIGAEDDNLDTDTGLQGRFQYVIAAQRSGGSVGDAMIEADSDNGKEADTPKQNTKVANFTFIERVSSSSDKAAMLIRGNSTYQLINGVVVSANLPCLRLSAPTASDSGRTALTVNSVQMQCKSGAAYEAGTNYTAAQVQAAFEAGTNVSAAYTPSLTSLFINGATETAVTAFDPKTADAFFDTTTYIGAVKDANDGWYKGWTCNSTSAAFDDTSNANRDCLSIPTT